MCQLCQCVWDHLRTLLLVVIVAKVSNYSAKKKNQDPPQARPPPSWNPESVETRRATRELFQYYVHHWNVASHRFHGKLTLIRKTSKAVYGSEHRMWEQCKISIGKRCQDSHKNRATLPKYYLFQPSLINIQCFVAKSISHPLFHTLLLASDYVGSKRTKNA